jgi:hypothetical protein
VDKTTRSEKQVRCKSVVVAASACESARLLLNSNIGNSSGVVGKYLTDTVGYAMQGQVPVLTNLPRYNSDGIGGMHVYVSWWLYDDKKKDFPRGYHIEIGGGFEMPTLGTFAGQCSRHQGYGKQLKDKIREEYGSFISFAGRGEMIPNQKSWCEIDPERVDAFGIPVLRFHFGWSDAELNQVRHMQDTFTSIIETLGGRVITPRIAPDARAGYLGRWVHHSRSRHSAHGQRSEEIGAQQILPVARCEESVCLRCCADGHQSGQERHA